MITNLKESLVACLESVNKAELDPIVTALKKTTKPIQNDEKLNKFFELLFAEIPELKQDPRIESFRQNLELKILQSPYQAKNH